MICFVSHTVRVVKCLIDVWNWFRLSCRRFINPVRRLWFTFGLFVCYVFVIFKVRLECQELLTGGAGGGSYVLDTGGFKKHSAFFCTEQPGLFPCCDLAL